jgi:hypothetical protein
MAQTEQRAQKPTIRLEIQTLPLTLIELTDGELARAVEAARATVNAPRLLERLEAEQQQRQEDAKARVEECVALVAECESLLAEAEHQSAADVEALERTPQRERSQELYQRARASWRRAFSRAHDLYHATHGDRRFYRPYRLPEVFQGMREQLRPVEDTEWRAKIARLIALKGPKTAAIGNGG